MRIRKRKTPSNNVLAIPGGRLLMLKRFGSGLREASSTTFFSGNPNMTLMDDVDAMKSYQDGVGGRIIVSLK